MDEILETIRQEDAEQYIFEPTGEWVLEDTNTKGGDPDVDGKAIIAKIKGQFFLNGGRSLNPRNYDEDFWPFVIENSELQRRLKDGLMFGQIGHKKGPITEDHLEKGEVSHRMKVLDILEGSSVGYGEALVFNTNAGRNLVTYMKGGSKLKPSSRGRGVLLRDRKGIEHPDKKSYYLEGFDFVIKNGIKEVNVEITESQKEETSMDNVEELKAKNAQLAAEKELLKKDVESLNKAKTELCTENAELKKTLESEAPVDAWLKEKKVSEGFKGKVCEDTEKALDQYDKLCEALGMEDPCKAVEEMQDKLDSYKELPEAEKIHETCERAAEIIEEYSTLGSKQEIEEILEMGKNIIDNYTAEGSVEEIREMKEDNKKMATEINESKNKEVATEISQKYEVPIDEALKMVKKHGEVETREICESFNTRGKFSSKQKHFDPKQFNPKQFKKQDINESRQEKGFLKTGSQSIFKSFC